MAQTSDIAPNLRAIYRKYLGFLRLNGAVHRALDLYANAFAHVQHFSFPAKFNWEWKMEMLTKKYERETVRLCRDIIKPGMHVVDIGAHVGYFSRIFSDLVGPRGVVYCFEADQENYAMLERNMHSRTNARLFHNAVAASDGSIDFYHLESSTGCHSIVAPNSAAKKVTVEAVALDSMLKRGDLERIDLIKMDIEGGEPQALRGMETWIASNRNIRLITEYNAESLAAGGIQPHEYISRLQALGFEVYGIAEDGLIRVRTATDEVLKKHLLPTGYINLYCEKR